MLTLHDSDKNNDDEEEEGNIVEHSGILQIITIRGFEFITNTTTCSDTGVEVVDEALKS